MKKITVKKLKKEYTKKEINAEYKKYLTSGKRCSKHEDLISCLDFMRIDEVPENILESMILENN